MRTVTLLHGKSEDSGLNIPVTKSEMQSMWETGRQSQTRFILVTCVFANRSEKKRRARMMLDVNQINNRKLTSSRVKSRQTSGLSMLPKKVLSFLSAIGKKARILFLRTPKS